MCCLVLTLFIEKIYISGHTTSHLIYFGVIRFSLERPGLYTRTCALSIKIQLYSTDDYNQGIKIYDKQ